MEKRLFRTRVSREHEFGENKFVIGKLVGIAEAIGINRNKDGIPYGIDKDENYRYIIGLATEEEYAKFKEIVNRCYSRNVFDGLIEFDI